MSLDVAAKPGRAAVFVFGPVFIIFVSSNVVNAGNLLFNVLFSRWMGPELFGELATILTIKLAILGILGAVQIAVSHRIAKEQASERSASDPALSRLNKICFLVLWLLLPLMVAGLWKGDIAKWLGLGSPLLPILLLLSLPFAVPLSISRGVAFGRLDVRHVLLSANAEMLVRLVGAVLAWKLGFGLAGVVAAVAISIIAGWAPLCTLLPKSRAKSRDWGTVGLAVAIAAIPFALLQASQVVLLDGDVILARIYLDAQDAGYVAALSLFQRVQFFACFGLAGVLLPSVSKAAAGGDNPLKPALTTAALFLAVSAAVLVLAAFLPGDTIRVFVGEAFLPAAPLLLTTAGAAAAFTLSYLLATFLSALGDTRGIWLVALACPIQLVAMSLHADNLSALLTIKLVCQITLAGLLVAITVKRCLHRNAPVSIPIPT